MSTEGLDCWDDYPMEHGCVCGNDCPPPAPTPYICQPCRDAIAASPEGFMIDHSCPAWGNADGSPVCECPDHNEWCEGCQDRHHPPVG